MNSKIGNFGRTLESFLGEFAHAKTTVKTYETPLLVITQFDSDGDGKTDANLIRRNGAGMDEFNKLDSQGRTVEHYVFGRSKGQLVVTGAEKNTWVDGTWTHIKEWSNLNDGSVDGRMTLVSSKQGLRSLFE